MVFVFITELICGFESIKTFCGLVAGEFFVNVVVFASDPDDFDFVVLDCKNDPPIAFS